MICTDMAIKAMEWVRSLGKRAPGLGVGGGACSEEHLHLGSRHQEQLQRNKEVRAMWGHLNRGNREFQGGRGETHQRLWRFPER